MAIFHCYVSSPEGTAHGEFFPFAKITRSVKWAPNGSPSIPRVWNMLTPMGSIPELILFFLGIEQDGAWKWLYFYDPEFFVDPIITIGHH